MKKQIWWLAVFLIISLAAFSVKVVVAKPDLVFERTAANPSQQKATVIIPRRAVEVAPGIFSLGTALDNGRVVEGYAFVDYKKGFGKPTGCNNDGKCQGWEDASCADCLGGSEPEESSCYGFLSKGAKWKAVEGYIVDSGNTRGLNPGFISSNLAADIDKWEDAADGVLDGSIINILGDKVAGVVDGVDMEAPDKKNEVYFADIKSANAIGMTVVWGIFRGPLSGRELVEWDQVYDDWDFDWSADCEAEACDQKMDFGNIATHELGHSVGMDDLYEAKCSEETMYGYAGYGETKKRTLESGDIFGISQLYP